MAITDEQLDTSRLVDAARVVLANMLDCDQWGPCDCDEHDNWPKDEDGDVWFPDIWELKEALNNFDDSGQHKEN